ncbi:MAG: RnfABCDGE type electron transport complex subunit D [Bacteroidales bacterium]|nr:RnfABCDGE type electron transport complex subunit D [Bacteroidales bacterium]
MMKLLNVSGSPHVHGAESVKRIMWDVNIALVPIFVVSLIFFGLDALFVSLVSVFCCILFQWLIEKFLLKKPTSISDGSAVITGLLLAFNVPSNLPLWIVAIGAFVAIVVGKMTFGGLGKNPFNPALVGRVFLLISFPVQMTTWPKANNIFDLAQTAAATDATTGATPLALIKEAVKYNDISLLNNMPDVWAMFIGQHGGSLGEVSAIAILIGGIYLLCRKVISWHIPVSFILTTFLFAALLNWIEPGIYVVKPIYHVLSGGLLLGAVFMATDMVTSPMTKAGQLVFGIGCGLLTIIIRTWGAYPEGVSFAILLMNAVTPLINKGFKPKRFAK